MADAPQWRRDLKPDPKVMELLDTLVAAAKKGHLRAVAVVTINPHLHVEPAWAGDIDPVRKNLLIGGLTKAAAKLSSE